MVTFTCTPAGRENGFFDGFQQNFAVTGLLCSYHLVWTSLHAVDRAKSQKQDINKSDVYVESACMVALKEPIDFK